MITPKNTNQVLLTLLALILLTTISVSQAPPAPCHSTCRDYQGSAGYCTSPQNINACSDCDSNVLQLSTSTCVNMADSLPNYVTTQIIQIIDTTVANSFSPPTGLPLTSMSLGGGSWDSLSTYEVQLLATNPISFGI